MQAIDPDPGRAYRERLAERRGAAERERRREELLAWVRLGLFLVGVVLAWLALFARALHWSWIAVPLGAFLAAVVLHERVTRRRLRARRAALYYERGLERLDDRWAGHGATGQEFLDPQHPYAADLDLFGPGSLFQLLSTARTHEGERTLADWLGSGASAAEVRERQAAVEELRDKLDLREQLALAGEEVRAGVDSRVLVAWSSAPPRLSSRGGAQLAALLGGLSLVGLALWTFTPLGPYPFLIAAAAGGALAGWLRSRARPVLGAVDRPARELELLATVLAILERERFACPRLVGLRARLDSDGVAPSRRIAHLARLVSLADSRSNLIFAPIAGLLLLGTQLAFALERWRRDSGPAVARWLAAVGELEALSALAGYAYERPADPFPEVLEDGPWFEGSELGHPLLPEARCVRNDVRLGGELRLLLVSGSNMSGKSTLLRTVGVNTVLALAGAPVRARTLRLSALSLGASMRVLDSLQEGMSHFYAEITRLRRLVDLAAGRPALLFLLDELLHGTNSHDRRIGAEALIRGLVERGALGLVTTHDLALARIADELAPRAANVHFEDRLEGERMVFDFKLRPGVVERSNALALMRAVGLQV